MSDEHQQWMDEHIVWWREHNAMEEEFVAECMDLALRFQAKAPEAADILRELAVSSFLDTLTTQEFIRDLEKRR